MLSGLVLTRDCRPVSHVLVDLSHADGAGDYDNRGFRGRGHQITDAQATRQQTEGPFFKPKSPMRSDLRSELKGTPVTLTGFVLTRDCRPVVNALVDLWHADADGEYDNRGYRGRGHQFTDAQGRYRFLTIRPARYTGRTPHYHVKVQAANGPVLTTQLYFPGEPANRRDPIYRRELDMTFNGAVDARFDFVLARA
jgi:protocatechuate 3,4-dioxygenase beta subunit